MPNYSLIKNRKLRDLVMNSESINSQSEEAITEMVGKIAGLPKEGRAAFIEALRDEEDQVRRAKEAQGITPESELKGIEENSIALKGIDSKLGRDVRAANEQVSRDADEDKVEALMNEINNPNL